MPPVTADRSPPDSRITGARLAGHRRLVDRRDALDDVAVAGDPLAGRDDDDVAGAQGGAGHLLDAAVGRRRRRAVVSCCSARRLAAWALPRPSATDSARVPKSTVSQSQTVTSQPSVLGSRTESTVVAAAPISTTSITGVREQLARVELAKAPGSAC